MNSILEIALIWGLILLWCIFAFMTFAICSVRERNRRKEKAKRDAYRKNLIDHKEKRNGKEKRNKSNSV